jgi:hypothetical protein
VANIFNLSERLNPCDSIPTKRPDRYQLIGFRQLGNGISGKCRQKTRASSTAKPPNTPKSRHATRFCAMTMEKPVNAGGKTCHDGRYPANTSKPSPCSSVVYMSISYNFDTPFKNLSFSGLRILNFFCQRLKC